jgi:hypothetical protein
MRFFDLDHFVLNNIFASLSCSPIFLNFRLVSSDFQTYVEDNTKLELDGSYERPFFYKPRKADIRLFRIDPILELPIKLSNSDSYQLSLADLRNFQLPNCIKKVSLTFGAAFKQTIQSFNDFSSILNQQTDFDISCIIHNCTPKPSSLIASGESLSELIPNLRLVSFDLICRRPFPSFVEDLIKFYLKNSNPLRKLKLNSIDLFQTVLKFSSETGQMWSNLKCLDIEIRSPEDIISGGHPPVQVPISQTFSDPTIYQMIPNLEELNITTYDCAIDLNGLTNFNHLKSVKLIFIVRDLKPEQANLIYRPDNFRRKVKSVKKLNLSAVLFRRVPLMPRIDLILEQFPSLRRLEISLDEDSDQSYLISSIRNGNLNQLESLDITRHDSMPSNDNQLPSLLCTDLIGTFCPKLAELSTNELLYESSLSILRNCSESIKQLTVNLDEDYERSEIKQLIKIIDSNQHTENIICNFEVNSNYPVGVWQLLRKFSKKIRLENIIDSKGISLIKFTDNRLLGSLIWKTKSQKKREIHFDDDLL